MTLDSPYKSFAELSVFEQEGSSYRREVKKRRSAFAIVAPHGGGIEPGTSEITRAIAGTQFSYYIFDGIREEGNERLHLTSTLFDEPKCLQVVNDSQIVIAVHGCEGAEKVIYAGGLHNDLKAVLVNTLSAAGFDAHLADVNYAGTHLRNICNRGRLRRGVQLEVSEGLRRAMFKAFDRQSRKFTTDVFWKFVVPIYDVLIAADKRTKSVSQ